MKNQPTTVAIGKTFTVCCGTTTAIFASSVWVWQSYTTLPITVPIVPQQIPATNQYTFIFFYSTPSLYFPVKKRILDNPVYNLRRTCRSDSSDRFAKA